MAYYDYVWQIPNEGIYEIHVDEAVGCSDERYLRDPVINFINIADIVNHNHYEYLFTSINYNNVGVFCLYVETHGDGITMPLTYLSTKRGTLTDFTIEGVDAQDNPVTGITWLPQAGGYMYDAWANQYLVGYTNIPIFETEAQAIAYVEETDESARLSMIRQYALNYDDGSDKPGKEFEITNPWTHGTWSPYGSVPDSPTAYRNVRGKLLEGGKVSFYKIPDIVDGSLKMDVIISGAFQGLEYSTDGITWHDTDSFPFEFFYRPREKENGTFNYGLTFVNNIFPEWESEEDALKYIRGELEESDAPNWDRISGNYPTQNGTGEIDDITDFGEVSTRNFFAQQYIVDVGALQEISDDLYDTSPGGIWEDIKKGLDMFGDSPIQAVMNLTWYPVNLLQVFTSVSSGPDIFFGGYQYTMDSHTAHKIIYPNGNFSCGTVSIKRCFNNWRDMPPFTRLFVELPYCGRYELDATLYYDKSVEVRYFIDTHTGACCACLIANGHLMDQFNGQIGSSVPITLTDFSAYANAQINTLLGGGGQAVNSGLSMGEAGAKAAAAGAGAGIASAGVGAAAMGAIQGAKTVYGLSMNNINKFNQTRGGSSGMINQYLNQKVTFTFETLDIDIPENFYTLKGGPSNAGGSVGSFSGYLEVDQVKLNIPGATETEKDKIRSLLMGGVYI